MEMTQITIAEQLRRFEVDGFAVIESLVDSIGIEFFREIGTHIRTDRGISVGGGHLLLDYPELVMPIVGSSRVLDIVERLMGPFVQLDSVSLVNVSGNCEAGTSWHRDPFGGMPRSEAFQRPLAVNLLIYLQDMTDRVGPLRVIPGSHRKRISMSSTERHEVRTDEKRLNVTAGSAILMHNNLIHSRTKNNSDRDRMHVSVVYVLSCMKSSIDLSAPGIRKMADLFERAGNRRLSRLLGQDQRDVDRYNSGFLEDDEESWEKWLAEDHGAFKY